MKQHNQGDERVKKRCDRTDYSAQMVTCSDHFFDEYYEKSAFLKSKLMPHEKSLHIPLKLSTGFRESSHGHAIAFKNLENL